MGDWNFTHKKQKKKTDKKQSAAKEKLQDTL